MVAAFEIECTTSIYSGLLRMADLQASCPNLTIPMFICLPEVRQGEVRSQLMRPSLRYLELYRNCGYITFESLKAQKHGLLRFASEPEAIRKIAQYVSEVE